MILFLEDWILNFLFEHDLKKIDRIKILMERNKDKLQEDVADLLWSFFGNMGHLIAERNASVGSMAERRFILKHMNKNI